MNYNCIFRFDGSIRTQSISANSEDDARQKMADIFRRNYSGSDCELLVAEGIGERKRDYKLLMEINGSRVAQSISATSKENAIGYFLKNYSQNSRWKVISIQ